MSRFAKTLATCLAASALLTVAFFPGAQAATSPQAQAARTCSVKNLWRKLGPTYVTKLAARGVSCADAKSFSKIYHRCRHRNGGYDGKCPRVRHFRCSEHRYNKNPVIASFDSDVVCKRGSQKITETFNEQK
jgi:hypothetical protein